MAKIELRKARPEDLGTIEALFESCAPACDPRILREYLDDRFRLLEKHGESAILVGVCDGELIGVIGLAADRYETNDVFWLSWLQPDGDEQSRRRHARLFDRLLSAVKQRGGRKLFADTTSLEGAGRRYEEMGFEVEARITDYFGKGVDQIIYGLDLTRRRCR